MMDVTPEAETPERPRGTWTDEGGRVWKCRVSLGVRETLRTDLRVETEAIFSGEIYRKFGDDYMFAFQCLYLICKKQADEENLESEAFSDLLLGDYLAAAIEAMVEGINDFFPNPRRGLLEILWLRVKAIESQATTLAAEKVKGAKATAAIEAAMEQAAKQIDHELEQLTEHPLHLPDSSESTPGDSPSES